ncbi:hypothetical protein EV182_003015 [Spiromyces aspiralis]|uniref:Uncharacterized protein n=1 Tax=Spiromyces aspiralis TaxID=68401 RepID=A0ACC1HUF0_9FUNG|nr:hypothetical protein EV182_003015 [Spiromyces aspiralis]
MLANSPLNIIAFQECHLANSPHDLFATRFQDYHVFGTKTPSDQFHDTATLISKKIEPEPVPIPMTSPARTTSILLPQSGIAVINVHAPTPPKADFFTGLHQHATLLQQRGWQILIIGDFNTTRNTYNRSTAKPPDAPPTFYELINAIQLLDVADHLYPADETLALRPEYSRDHLFTFGKTKEGKWQLVSRIDLFLAQASIIARVRCRYHAMDVGQLSDHKAIYLHLIPPTPNEAAAICPPFRVVPNLINDPRHK